MVSIVLRRYTVPIGRETPLCVIDHLSEIYGIPDSLPILERITHINDDSIRIRIPRSGKEWTNDTWRMIGRFVNPRIDWNQHRLYKAFLSILASPIIHRRYGIKNNDSPEIGDVIDAYNLCSSFKIPLSSTTTYNDMTLSIFIVQSPLSLRALSFTDGYAQVQSAYEENDPSMVLMPDPECITTTPRYPPVSEADALALGWKMDVELSLADSKLVEYYHQTLTGDGAIPQCDRCQHIFRTNQHRLRFGVYFNPRAPFEYYTHKQISCLAVLEGIKGTPQEKYTELVAMSVMDNFHHLLQPEVKETCTPYSHEPYTSIDKLLIVSYGVMTFYREDFDMSTMSAYSIPELTHMFKSNGTFVNSLTQERFPEHAIGKLVRLCHILRASASNGEVREACRELLQVIELVKERECGNKEIVDRWAEVFRASTSMMKDAVAVLNKLLHAGMYMRKWDGMSEYPIKTVPPGVMTIEHDDRVYQTIEEFEKLDAGLNRMVSSMPLMKYEFSCFSIVTDPFEGLTIQQRIDIVKQGNTTPVQNSCVMWSSNLFITSSYYYLMILDHAPTDFHIGELVHMS